MLSLIRRRYFSSLTEEVVKTFSKHELELSNCKDQLLNEKKNCMSRWNLWSRESASLSVQICVRAVAVDQGYIFRGHNYNKLSAKESFKENNEWKIINDISHIVTKTSPKLSSSSTEYPQITFNFQIKRKTGYYFWNIITY